MESTIATPLEELNPRPAPPFSYPVLQTLETIIAIVASGGFAIFGLVSNIINIVVFYRQGILSNSSMVNLTGLAVSDFFNCLLTAWYAVLLIVMHHFADYYSWESSAHALYLITAIRPLEMTLQMTCWITAFTAMERVICVVFPFKVKSIITPKISLAVILAIFVITFIICIPATIDFIFVWETSPVTNKTYLSVDFSNYLPAIYFIIYSYVSSLILRFTSIFVVAMCNIILYWKISLSQKFRKATTGVGMTSHVSRATHDDSGKKDNIMQVRLPKPKTDLRQNQTKDMKLLRMITVVSSVFIVCYSVYIIVNVLYWIVWEPHVDVSMVEVNFVWKVSNFVQIVNSSTNIFIYYNMSSRFREEFDKLFCKKKLKA